MIYALKNRIYLRVLGLKFFTLDLHLLIFLGRTIGGFRLLLWFSILVTGETRSVCILKDFAEISDRPEKKHFEC